MPFGIDADEIERAVPLGDLGDGVPGRHQAKLRPARRQLADDERGRRVVERECVERAVEQPPRRFPFVELHAGTEIVGRHAVGLEHAQRLELGLAPRQSDRKAPPLEVADLGDAAVGERHEMQVFGVGAEQVAHGDPLRQAGEPALGRGPGHVGLRQRELDLALRQQLHVLGGAARLRRHGVEIGAISRNDVGHRRAERVEHAALAGGADEELRARLRM